MWLNKWSLQNHLSHLIIFSFLSHSRQHLCKKNKNQQQQHFQAFYNNSFNKKKDSVPKMHVSRRLSVHCWGSECFDSLSAFGPGGKKSNNKSAGAPHNNTHTQLQTVDSTLLVLSNSSGTHALDIWDKPGHFSRALPAKSSTVPRPLMPHTFWAFFVVCLWRV